MFENIVNRRCRGFSRIGEKVGVSGAHFYGTVSHKLGYHGLSLSGEGKPACVRMTQGMENDFLPCVSYGNAVRVRKKIGKGLCQSDKGFKFRLKRRGHDLMTALAVFGVSDVNVFAVKIYVADFELGNLSETQTAVQADECLQINGEAVLFEFVKKHVSFLRGQKTHAAVVHFGQGDFGKRLCAMIKTPVVHFVDDTLYDTDKISNALVCPSFAGKLCNQTVKKINIDFIDVYGMHALQVGVKKAFVVFIAFIS